MLKKAKSSFVPCRPLFKISNIKFKKKKNLVLEQNYSLCRALQLLGSHGVICNKLIATVRIDQSLDFNSTYGFK